MGFWGVVRVKSNDILQHGFQFFWRNLEGRECFHNFRGKEECARDN